MSFEIHYYASKLSLKSITRENTDATSSRSKGDGTKGVWVGNKQNSLVLKNNQIHEVLFNEINLRCNVVRLQLYGLQVCGEGNREEIKTIRRKWI